MTLSPMMLASRHAQAYAPATGVSVMAIPDYQTIMLPLLQLSNQTSVKLSTRTAVEALANTFQLTDAERRELLPSGTQSAFVNRVGWAALRT
jgi:restriction system protein